MNQDDLVLVINVLNPASEELKCMTLNKHEVIWNSQTVNHTNNLGNMLAIKCSYKEASAFSNLLKISLIYAKCVWKYWTSLLSLKFLNIYLQAPIDTSVDYKGCHMSLKILWQMIELEDALHWLSTLGGAFSNLGENNVNFALKAGTNAMKQLMVAMKCDDHSVVAKCWLFVGQSLLQQERFTESSKILKSVWRACHSPPLNNLNSTNKLINMTKGIWARLQHEIKKHKR